MSVQGAVFCFHAVHKPHMLCIHIENEMLSFGCACCCRCIEASCYHDVLTCLYSIFFSLPFACIPQLCCVQPGYLICDNKFEYPSNVCFRNITHLILPTVCFPILCFRSCCLKPWGSYQHDIQTTTSHFSSKIAPGIQIY